MRKLDESTEETQAILEEWREEAHAMTMENLPEFLERITKEYEHDYGTICHAISIGGIATMYAINNSDQGGITGFQAGAVMWENIMNWDSSYRGKPLTLVDYSNMLYPQYEYKFQKTISNSTRDYLIKEAKRNLKENPDANPDVIEHWKQISEGVVPFNHRIVKDD